MYPLILCVEYSNETKNAYLPHKITRSSSVECVKAAAKASFQLLISQLLIMDAQSSEIMEVINSDM